MDSENKKEYEIAFLLKSAEAEKNLINFLKQSQAEVFYQKPAAEIKLSYPMDKLNSAYFGFCHFKADSQSIAGLEETLRLKDYILRFLIVTPPVKITTTPQMGKPERKTPPPVVSNEALEEKLEEILK